jgi:hypothetical protein
MKYCYLMMEWIRKVYDSIWYNFWHCSLSKWHTCMWDPNPGTQSIYHHFHSLSSLSPRPYLLRFYYRYIHGAWSVIEPFIFCCRPSTNATPSSPVDSKMELACGGGHLRTSDRPTSSAAGLGSASNSAGSGSHCADRRRRRAMEMA